MAPSNPRTLVAIPSRFASSRLPGKALAEIDGQPMVWHVYRRAREAGVGPVVVATDDARIRDAVRARGGDAVMTSARWRNGSERVAEVARSRPEAELVVNLQGDEPLMDPAVLVDLVRFMADHPEVPLGTPGVPLRPGQIEERSVVKLEVDDDGMALAFWRDPGDRVRPGGSLLRHLGLYAFRREALERYAALPPSPLERERSLEQLRAMENGIGIGVLSLDAEALSVDTAGDLQAVRRQLAARG